MLLWLTTLMLTGGPSGLADGEVTLPDGRTTRAHINLEDVGQHAVRIAPILAEGAFGAFGETFQGAVAFECRGPGSPIPVLSEQHQLTCPPGASPALRPDVTWPDDATAWPSASVPQVKPGGRPVVASTDTFILGVGPVALASAVLLVFAVWAWRRGRATGPAPEAPALPRTDLGLAFGLTALAAALRLLWLGSEPFEQNEFTYVMTAFGHASARDVLLDVNAMAQTHAPLPHLLGWLISGLGLTEWTARLPSAIAGVLTVPLVFLVGHRLGGRATAVVAALLGALSPVHAWYSQDASPYTITTFFAAVALLGAEGAARTVGRRGLVTLTAGTVGLFYSHYYGLHLSLGLYGALLTTALLRKDSGFRWRTLGSGALSAAALLPWLPAFVQAYAWSRGHSTAYQRDAGVYHATASLPWDLLDALRLTGGLSAALIWASLLGPCLFAVWVARGALPRGHRAWLLAPVVWFIPFEIVNRETFLNGLYGGYYFGIRYALFLFPIAWLVGGLGVSAALRLSKRAPLRWVTLAALALTVVDGARETITTLVSADKPDVRSAAALVTSHLAEGDAVLVGPAAFYVHPWHYYAAPAASRQSLRVNDLMPTPDWRPNGTIGVLSDLVEPYDRTLKNAFIRRVWVVDHTQHLFDRREFSDRPSQAIDAAVSTAFHLVWQRAYHDVTVRLFERTAPSVAAPSSHAPTRVHFGWNDGPWVRGVDPPTAWTSLGRRARRVVEIALPKAPRAAIRLRAGAAPLGPVALREVEETTPVVVRVSADGTPLTDIVATGTMAWTTVTLPPALTDVPMTLRLESEPTPAGRSPSVLVLDVLDVVPAVPTTPP